LGLNLLVDEGAEDGTSGKKKAGGEEGAAGAGSHRLR
jgi:hypothetical protein